MHFLQSILPAVVVLGALITIHEYGHFIACRLMKVRVEKFSIGFGPELLHWQGKETRYAISLFPLGGFVKPAGESIGEVEDGELKDGDFLKASVWARIFIVCAGVIMNYALAFVLFVAIFMMGRPVPGTTIGGFVDGYPAEQSGLQVEDRIVEIEGEPVATWNELTTALDETNRTTLNLVVERSGQAVPIIISPKVEDVDDIFGKSVTVKRLGITPHPEAQLFEKFGFVDALKEAWKIEVFLTVTTHKAIFYLVTGRLSMETMSGPIGIVNMTGTAARLGLPYLLHLTAVLSVSLAVLNLLPIPALDGGHLFFLLIEAIRRKQVSLQVQERATQVGFILLLGLMAFVIYSDLAKLDFFQRIFGMFQGS